MTKRNNTPLRVVCEQEITPEWAQELIRKSLPALRELYLKGSEHRRAPAGTGQPGAAGMQKESH
ncbi:MAG: hypothetical protein ACYCZF_13650 [Anaerolineae bacterium]